MSGLRYRRLWLAVGIGLVALVVYLSLSAQPGKVASASAGHLVAYFVLTIWFAQLWRAWPMRCAVGTAFVLMGIGLEYAQGMTTHRVFDLADMRDNTIGVVIGLALAATPLGNALAKFDRWLAAR